MRNLFSISSWREGGSLNSSPAEILALPLSKRGKINQCIDGYICIDRWKDREGETNPGRHPPNQLQYLSHPTSKYPHVRSLPSHPQAPLAGTSHRAQSSSPCHGARARQYRTPDAATPSSWHSGSGATPPDGLREGVRTLGSRFRRWLRGGRRVPGRLSCSGGCRADRGLRGRLWRDGGGLWGFPGGWLCWSWW